MEVAAAASEAPKLLHLAPSACTEILLKGSRSIVPPIQALAACIYCLLVLEMEGKACFYWLQPLQELDTLPLQH